MRCCNETEPQPLRTEIKVSTLTEDLRKLFVFVYEFKNENKGYTVAFSINMQHTLVFISPTYVLHVHAE